LEIVYQKSFPTRQQAHQREKKIKSKKSRKYIQWLISSTDSSVCCPEGIRGKGHRFDSGNLHFTGQHQIFEQLPGFLLAETLPGIPVARHPLGEEIFRGCYSDIAKDEDRPYYFIENF